MQIVRPRCPSMIPERSVWMATRRLAFVAVVGRFGLSDNLGPVKESVQPTIPNPAPRTSNAAARRVRIPESSSDAGGGQRLGVAENTKGRVWGLLNQSIPRAPVSAPERLVSGSAPVYGAHTARFRPATRTSRLLRPRLRLTNPPVME